MFDRSENEHSDSKTQSGGEHGCQGHSFKKSQLLHIKTKNQNSQMNCKDNEKASGVKIVYISHTAVGVCGLLIGFELNLNPVKDHI